MILKTYQRKCPIIKNVSSSHFRVSSSNANQISANSRWHFQICTNFNASLIWPELFQAQRDHRRQELLHQQRPYRSNPPSPSSFWWRLQDLVPDGLPVQLEEVHVRIWVQFGTPWCGRFQWPSSISNPSFRSRHDSKMSSCNRKKKAPE